MDDLEQRQRRLARARFLIRAEFAIALVVPLVAGFLYLAMPNGPSPMFGGPPPRMEGLELGAGVGLWVIGSVWMIRLPGRIPKQASAPGGTATSTDGPQ